MDLGDVELTEFEAIDVQTIKGVREGANGFPILMMKGLAPAAEAEETAEPEFDRDAARELVKAIIGRKVDESPDIAGGTAVLAQIADLIIAEAQELKAGNAGEICDIQQLACAAEMIWCWRTGEEAVASGSVQPATALMQSAAKTVDWTDEQRAEWVAELQKAIPGARLLPPGDASLPGSDGDTAKSQIAPEETTVDTETQETGGLSKAVEDAIAKATAPLQERIASLDAELAKVKATPVPSALVLSRNVQVKQPGAVANEDYAAKAAYYLDMAEQVTDRATADGYRKLAREASEKAVTTPS